MVMSSLLDGSKSMPDEKSKKRKWMSRKDEAAVPSDKATQAEAFEHEAGHHRKQGIRDAADHSKPRKGAEGLKKSFYGHKLKEGK